MAAPLARHDESSFRMRNNTVTNEGSPNADRSTVAGFSPPKSRCLDHRFTWPVLASALVALIAFWWLTPPGLLAKADVVGCAVCHRWTSHSLTMSGRQLPLCARCTGTFLGALIGLFGQVALLRRSRSSEFPPAHIIAILVAFTCLMAADGLNSYLALLNGPDAFYQPQNWLRLATGAMHGLSLSILIVPVFGATIWREPTALRNVSGIGELARLMTLEAIMVALVLTGWPLLLYPVAVSSALGVLTLLSAANTVLLVLATGREGRATSAVQLLVPCLGGLAISIAQIGAISLLRYALTGTCEGIRLGY